MMVLPTFRGVITLSEAAKREQSKALWRAKRTSLKTAHPVHLFIEPCFRCGSAGECRHRRADNG